MPRGAALLFFAALLFSTPLQADDLSLAREHFLAKDSAKAQEVLRAIREAKGREAPYAAYLQGHILYSERHFAEASEAFQAAESLPIGHYARFYRAESLFWAHDASAARRLFSSIAADKESPFGPWARLRIADADLALGDVATATREYRAFLADYPSYPYPEAIAFALAECARRTGDTSRAADVYLSLWVEYPHTRYAGLAIQARQSLRENGSPFAAPSLLDRVERARNLRDQRLHVQALDELDTLKRELLASTFAGDAALMVSVEVERGRTLLRLARGKEAAEALSSVADASAVALRYLGDAYAIAGEAENAAEAYAKHLGISDGKARGKEIRPFADFLFDVGLYERALAEYEKLSSRDNDVAFRIAWCNYRAGHYSEALDAFKNLPRRGSEYKELSRYWSARIAERQGDKSEASKGYRALVDDEETSYYGILARSRLASLGEITLPASQAADTSHVKAVRPSEAQIEAAFSALRAGARGKEATERAYVFYRLGLEGNAREELESVYYEAKSGKGAAFRSRSPYFPANWSRENSSDSLLLASTVKEGTVGDPSAVTKKKGKSSKPASPPTTPAESAAEPLAEPLGEVSGAESGNFWMNLGTAFSGVGDAHYPMYLLSVTGGKRYYPQAYPAEVLPIGDEFSHSPEELWALMHTESTFHRFVASRVGAIGLMQIMPKTGRAIAARLGFDDFRPGQLFDASTNLYFAGWYYRKLKEVFQGQLPLAMAAYNGGPYMIGRIIRAKTWTKPELDEIIEEIPARESRLYAKKVMYKTSKYQKLYKGETWLAVDLTLNTNVGLQVDF